MTTRTVAVWRKYLRTLSALDIEPKEVKISSDKRILFITRVILSVGLLGNDKTRHSGFVYINVKRKELRPRFAAGQFYEVALGLIQYSFSSTSSAADVAKKSI